MTLFNDPAPTSRGRTTTLTLASFLDLFDEVETESNGYVVLCPSHPDSRVSLRVGYNAQTKKLAIKCRAGCETPDVLAALSLSMADLFDVEPGDLADVRTAGSVPEKPTTGDRAALALYLDRAAAALQESTNAGAAWDYLARRFGITPEKAAELGLGYDDTTVDGGRLVLSRALYHDTERLVVPFDDFDGHPHYLQARALHGEGVKAKWSGPNNPEGAAWGKYGVFHGGSGWAEVVITEGPGDALTATAVGYDTVLIRGAGLGNNAAMADELAAGLTGRRVVVAGDADAAGLKFSRDVAQALSERGIDVHKLTIPGEANDITKWRETAGSTFPRLFIEAVQEAPRYGSDQITVEQIAQEVTRLFSDVYNAKTLLTVIQEQGGDVRFTTEAGFIVYRPELGTWELDHAEWVRSQAQTVASRVQRAILDSMQAMDARVAGMDDKDLRATTGELLDAQRRKARGSALVSYVMSTRGIDSMIRELRALPGVFASYEDFDQHPHLLAVSNGVVNLEDGSLAAYSPETKDLLLLRRVDTPYIPGARNPRWEAFLAEVFENHAEVPDYMRRLIGYGITGFTTEQALAVFYGGGSNGKGVLIETLTGLLTGITTTTPFDTFEQKPSGGIPNDIAALKGSRLVMASEGEQGRQMAESLIKRLTGGDTISARFMRKEFFSFKPTFLILLATNYKPNFRGQDYGLWRRVKLVPFDRTFSVEERDNYLTAKFLGQRVPAAAYRDGEDYGDGPAGILAWAVRGSMDWFQSGLEDPEVITRATSEFKTTSDALIDFYEEFLIRDEDGRIKGSDVYDLYSQWCEDEHLPSKERWTRKTFWSALEERGAVKVKPQGSVAFKGIRRRRPSEIASDSIEDVTPDVRADDPQLADVLSTTPDDGTIQAPPLDAFTP